MDAKIVVVSGLTAGGKTTLINAMHEVLTNSKIISFDDYDIDALPSSPPLGQPLSQNVGQYDISAIVKEVNQSKGSYEVLLLDFPFGNHHPDLKPLIDYTVYNQTPLDIVLARRIIRDFSQDSFGATSWANMYLTDARNIYKSNELFVMSGADLVLDGTVPLRERVAMIIKNGPFRDCLKK